MFYPSLLSVAIDCVPITFTMRQPSYIPQQSQTKDPADSIFMLLVQYGYSGLFYGYAILFTSNMDFKLLLRLIMSLKVTGDKQPMSKIALSKLT